MVGLAEATGRGVLTVGQRGSRYATNVAFTKRGQIMVRLRPSLGLCPTDATYRGSRTSNRKGYPEVLLTTGRKWA